MEVIIREIENALAAGLYYLAIITALSLPDICGALESPDGKASRQRYSDWCDQWFTEYPQVSSLDLYYMRCGVLHQGRLGHPNLQYARILFTLPDARGNVFHQNVINDALNLDAVTFCRDMVNAVSRWYAARQNEPNVVANLPRVIRFHQNGLPPYIVGVPLIA